MRLNFTSVLLSTITWVWWDFFTGILKRLSKHFKLTWGTFVPEIKLHVIMLGLFFLRRVAMLENCRELDVWINKVPWIN